MRNRLDQLTLAGSPADDQEVFIRNLQGKSLVTLIIIINMIVLMMTLTMTMITKSMILDVKIFYWSGVRIQKYITIDDEDDDDDDDKTGETVERGANKTAGGRIL